VHRIDTPTADITTDPLKPRFRGIDVPNGFAATQVSPEFLNDVQESLATVVEGSGGALVKGRSEDVADAIGRMIGGASSAHTLLSKDVAGGAAEIVLTQPETSRVVIDLTGARTGDLILTLHNGMPASRVVRDSTTGGFAVKVKVAGQNDAAAVDVPSGGWALLITDGVTVSVLASTGGGAGTAIEQGYHSMVLSPAQFEPTSSGTPAVHSTVSIGVDTSVPPIATIAFDPATEQVVSAFLPLPKSVDLAAVAKVRLGAIAAAADATTGDAKFQVQLVAISAAESLAPVTAYTDLGVVNCTTAFNATAEVDVPITTTAATDPALLLIRVSRKSADVADVLTAKAHFTGLDLKLSYNAPTDI
jgi:hypothetical protein